MGVPLVDILKQNPDNEIVVTSRSHHYSDCPNVNYVLGDARDPEFLSGTLKWGADVLIDFMNYNLDEFEIRIKEMLSACKQYIWFSSARVYAQSQEPLTEDSPRLLETSNDKEFLATNRYALRKARQEDLLLNSGFKNYTIIRPYITYNRDRLQLGILEKEQWLYRLLKNRPLVLSAEMLGHTTTLSYGNDVSGAVAELIGNEKALGNIIQIAGADHILWKDLLNLYVDLLKQHTGQTPTVYVGEDIKAIEMLYEGGYNTIYDRNYDRTFNSQKVNDIIGHDIEYTEIRQGISKSLTEFLNGNRKFLYINPIYEAYQDLLTNSMSERDDFNSDEDWESYCKYRNMHLSDIPGLSGKITRII